MLNQLKEHMEKHAELIRPKFEIAYSHLEELPKNVEHFQNQQVDIS